MRTRKVYLKMGYVYIPHQDIVTIVLNDFRTRLSKALAVSVHKLRLVAKCYIVLDCMRQLGLKCKRNESRTSPVLASELTNGSSHVHSLPY